MSQAKDTFDQAILDAEHLLRHFDALNTRPPPPDIEVLKRAGLIIALTAWETYVEDRVSEAVSIRLARLDDPKIVAFIRAKLETELKRLHNPTSAKTLELFRDYAGVDLTGKWKWGNHTDKVTCNRLDEYIRLRGEVVHRSRAISQGRPQAHAVTKEDLQRAIRFLKQLVLVTEQILDSSTYLNRLAFLNAVSAQVS